MEESNMLHLKKQERKQSCGAQCYVPLFGDRGGGKWDEKKIRGATVESVNKAFRSRGERRGGEKSGGEGGRKVDEARFPVFQILSVNKW